MSAKARLIQELNYASRMADDIQDFMAGPAPVDIAGLREASRCLALSVRNISRSLLQHLAEPSNGQTICEPHSIAALSISDRHPCALETVAQRQLAHRVE